jgi:hypothetical protein
MQLNIYNQLIFDYQNTPEGKLHLILKEITYAKSKKIF